MVKVIFTIKRNIGYIFKRYTPEFYIRTYGLIAIFLGICIWFKKDIVLIMKQ